MNLGTPEDKAVPDSLLNNLNTKKRTHSFKQRERERERERERGVF